MRAHTRDGIQDIPSREEQTQKTKKKKKKPTGRQTARIQIYLKEEEFFPSRIRYITFLLDII
jgi:hypothetical protein